MADIRLRWGILGTGRIARQFAAGILASDRGALVAVGSRQRDTAEAFAEQFHIPRVYDSYDPLLVDPQLDAIYISLPNSLHHEWTLKALDAGKDVLCEKPLAANLAQATEMFAAAAASGRLLMEAFMYRSHPLTAAVKNAVDAGKIGQLRIIRTSFLFAGRGVEGNVRFDPNLAGGSLMDVGCYCLSFARLFARAEPDTLFARGHLHETGVDDYAAGILQFPNGILSTFACGITVRADNTATLLGTEGYIEIPAPWKPASPDAAFTIVDASGTRTTETIHVPKHIYALEADDFASAALYRKPPPVSREDSLANQRCLDELRRQIGLGY